MEKKDKIYALKTLKEHIKKNSVKTGLCREVAEFKKERILPKQHIEYLENTIQIHRTGNVFLFSGFYFPQGNKELRIEYLDKLIKLVK